MQTYEEMYRKIRVFLNEQKIHPRDADRIIKDMCNCGHCKHFVAHYLADGTLTDFGHCTKNKIPKCVRPSELSCGFWDE